MQSNQGRRSRRVCAVAVVLAIATACGPESSPVATVPDEAPAPAPPKQLVLPDSAYRAELTLRAPLAKGAAGTTATATVSVKNVTGTAWPEHRSDFAINLTYHWRNREGSIVVYDGVRTPLTVALAPGQAAEFQAAVRFPPSAGDYILEFDLVQEWVTWFADKGSATARVDVRVE